MKIPILVFVAGTVLGALVGAYVAASLAFGYESSIKANLVIAEYELHSSIHELLQEGKNAEAKQLLMSVMQGDLEVAGASIHAAENTFLAPMVYGKMIDSAKEALNETSSGQ